MGPEDIAIAQFKLLDPQRFTFLQQLTLFQDFQAEDALSLKIELLSDRYEREELHLSFYGIQQLKMGIDRIYIQVKVEITSMRESQWESLKYFVKAEDNQLSFYCRDFEARLIRSIP